VLAEQGYELVEVEYGRQGRTGRLRLYIDRTGGGITLDDCQRASQLLGATLDQADFLRDSYVLEISSPGVNRVMRRPEDFERFKGERILLVVQTALEGRRKFSGTLQGYRDGMILLDCDGKSIEIYAENLKKAHLERFEKSIEE
jgi:ribosome maturation factor RimP